MTRTGEKQDAFLNRTEAVVRLRADVRKLCQQLAPVYESKKLAEQEAAKPGTGDEKREPNASGVVGSIIVW
jgi:hypothetical protein